MMKIEYIESGSEDCPLVRLFGFEESDVASLRDACLSLAAGSIAEFRLDSQSWVESMVGCNLILRLGVKNLGARWGKRVNDAFTIELNSEGWLDVSDRIQPFITNHTCGFQWLEDQGAINVLLSWDGRW